MYRSYHHNCTSAEIGSVEQADSANVLSLQQEKMQHTEDVIASCTARKALYTAFLKKDRSEQTEILRQAMNEVAANEAL